MGKNWVIGFWFAAMILAVVALLGEAQGAVLGMLVLSVITLTGFIGSHFVTVRESTALVVRSAWDGRVLRIVPGPARTLLLPFLETPGSVLDTSFRMDQVVVENILQPDRQPFPFSVTVFIEYQPDLSQISVTELASVLPRIGPNTETTVRDVIDYAVRDLVLSAKPDLLSTRSPDDLQPDLNKRLSLRLSRSLRALGISVQGLRIVMQLPAGIRHTTQEVEQLRICLDALKDQTDPVASLALLELSRAGSRELRTQTEKNMASRLQPKPPDDPKKS